MDACMHAQHAAWAQRSITSAGERRRTDAHGLLFPASRRTRTALVSPPALPSPLLPLLRWCSMSTASLSACLPAAVIPFLPGVSRVVQKA